MGTNWITKSVTEGARTKYELEHKKCHGGSDNKARSGAQKVSRRERQQSTKWSTKKCHGGSDNKARRGAQKVSRRERQQSTNLNTKSVTEGAQQVSRRERQQSTKWDTKSVTEEATKKHELKHKKCYGGKDQRAGTLAQKVSRRERPTGKGFVSSRWN